MDGAPGPSAPLRAVRAIKFAKETFLQVNFDFIGFSEPVTFNLGCDDYVTGDNIEARSCEKMPCETLYIGSTGKGILEAGKGSRIRISLR